MLGRRKERGSGIILLTLGVVIVAAIVGFFALNYAQLFAVKKKAQTAIDAAALEAARGISTVTINNRATLAGPIALIDIPVGAPFHPKTSAVPATAPVRGFNSALAVVRLDHLIAKDIQNAYMVELIHRDLDALKTSAATLSSAIQTEINPGGSVHRKVKDAFIKNYPKLNSGQNVDPNSLDLKITLGRLKKNVGTTNIPVPSGEDALRLNGGASPEGRYNANRDLPIDNEHYVFAAIADEPSLVTETDFSTNPGEVFIETAPSVVQVRVKFRVQSLTAPSGKKDEATLENVASAQAGGSVTINPSTVYQVGFTGGFPTTSGDQGKFNRISVADIARAGPQAWQPIQNQSAVWLQADPANTSSGSPAGSPPGRFNPTTFPGTSGALADNFPSKALAFGVYDWLRSLGLRVDRSSASAALQQDLRDLAKNSELVKTVYHEDKLMQPALAQIPESLIGDEVLDPTAAGPEDDETDETGENDDQADDYTVQTSAFSVEPNPSGLDPRFDAILNDPNGEGFEFLVDAFSYKPVKGLVPEESMSLLVDPIVGAINPGGSDLDELCRLVEGLIATSRAGCVSRYGGLLATFKGREDSANARMQKQNAEQQLREAVLALATVAEARDSHMQPDGGRAAVLEQAIPPILMTLDRATIDVDKFRFIRKRAIRCRYNGIFAHNRAQRTVKRLKRWTARGIKELHYNGPADNAQVLSAQGEYDGAEYAVNIKGAPRLVNIMPNTVLYDFPAGEGNGNYSVANRLDPMCLMRDPLSFRKSSFRRNNGGQDTTDNIYNLRPYTEEDLELFRDMVYKVKENVGPVKRTFEDRVTVGDGHPYTVRIANVDRLEYTVSDKKLRFIAAPIRTGVDEHTYTELNRKPAVEKYRWDAGRHDKEHESGRSVLRRYRERLAAPNFKPIADLRKKFDENLCKSQGLCALPPQMHGDWFAQPALAQTAQPETLDRVFLFRCVGSKLKGGGKVEIRYLKDQPRFPFSKNRVLAGQFLYFANNAISQGTKEPVFRSVVARDQVAELGQGNSLQPQDEPNYCRSGFGIDIGNDQVGQCPVMGGEFRIGPPVAVACCKLNPDKKQLQHKALTRRNLRLSIFFDNERAEDLDEDNLPDFFPPDEDPNLCPKIPKRFG